MCSGSICRSREEIQLLILHNKSIFLANKNDSLDQVFYTTFEFQVSKFKIGAEIGHFVIFRFPRARILIINFYLTGDLQSQLISQWIH